MTQRLFRIDSPIRPYAWGSTTGIPEVLGVAATGEPQAEMWLGAHPSAPSIVRDSGLGLDALLAERPALLGPDAGDGLPFLMKLLAAGAPLSLQVHPTTEQAEAGFARENAAWMPLNDPRRSYRDAHHKPELILAVTPFAALSGFRAPARSRADVAELLGPDADGVPGATTLLDALALPDEAEALRTAFTFTLSGAPELPALLERVVAGARDAASATADTVRVVAAAYPGDPGILGATLLNRVDLAPGEAMFLDAGNVHAYLHGVGIEAMAPSDNVLRGGLTAKHIDVRGLLDIVSFRSVSPQRLRPEVSTENGVTLTSYYPPVDEFAVHVVDAAGGARTLAGIGGPATMLATAGVMRLDADGDSLRLARGETAFLAVGDAVRVSVEQGPARVYLTTPGRPPAASPSAV